MDSLPQRSRIYSKPRIALPSTKNSHNARHSCCQLRQLVVFVDEVQLIRKRDPGRLASESSQTGNSCSGLVEIG